MADERSTTIAPIAFFCFLLGALPLSLALSIIFSHQTALSNGDIGWWANVLGLIILGAGLLVVAIGFYNLNEVCWKTLFYFLSITVSSLTALVLIFVICFILNLNILSPFININNISSGTWFSFLLFFLSEIIILYYLTCAEVTSNFKGVNDRISPF